MAPEIGPAVARESRRCNARRLFLCMTESRWRALRQPGKFEPANLSTGGARRNNPWGADLIGRRHVAALARGPGTAPDPLCRSRSRDLEPCSDERAALRWPMLIFKSNLMVLPFSANGLHATIDVSAAPLPTSLRRALLRNAYGSSRPSRCLSCISTISTPLLGVN